MKTKAILIFLIILMISCLTKAEVNEIPFTTEDRDRLIRTEQKVESLDGKIDDKVDGLRSEMNARFEAMDKRFDQLFNFLWAIIGIFTTMMVAVFGFAFWDRKLSLKPATSGNAPVS